MGVRRGDREERLESELFVRWKHGTLKLSQESTSTSSFKGTQMGSTPIDIFLTQSLQLRLREHLRRGGRKILRVRRGSGHLLAAC